MNLTRIACDRLSFRTLNFNSEGVSLILGDGPASPDEEGSSNGVGKTLAAYLLHHCLGANTEPRLKKAVPNWNFLLVFHVNGVEHTIERQGDGKNVRIDGQRTSLAGLRQWFSSKGIIYLDPDVPNLSWRALIKRFARYKRNDCVEPLRMNKEPDFDSELRSLYLLGLDCTLALRKQAIKAELERINVTTELWKSDSSLREMFRSGTQPKLRAEWLEREIPRLRSDLENFQVAENYRHIEQNASKIGLRLEAVSRREAEVEYSRSLIQDALANHPDITREDLLNLYAGAKEIFKAETLAHFEAVEQFHTTLSANRRSRLTQDLASVTAQLAEMRLQRASLAQERDSCYQELQGKHALDEYAVLAGQVASLEEELARIREYMDFSTGLQERALEQRERRLEQDREANAYLLTDPVRDANVFYKGIAEALYPSAPSGILLETNTGDNKIRFNIAVEIEGEDSDGINSARILCFDWLLLMRGANHAVNFLWHDNRLFADIAPNARAAWFTYVIRNIQNTGKQYIASMNTENYEAMKPFLPADVQEKLAASVIITLQGDAPENKLLGVQFG